MSHKEAEETKKSGAIEASNDAASTSYVTSINKNPTKGLLLVRIYAPFKTFYEGDAKSVSALNATGAFDVLPGHHNFISMLMPCEAVVETPQDEKKTIPVTRGLMHVREDRVTIFMDV